MPWLYQLMVETLQEKITALTAVIGEKMTLRRFKLIEKTDRSSIWFILA
jgi:translation elongation factor EF-Ts